jgi:hypothetical protein
MKNKPKVKTKKKPEENFDFMKTNKDNLKNIVKNPETINIINEIAIKTNKIVIHAYNFIKLYCLYLYKENKPLPTFDKDYISDIFKVITIRKCGSGGYTDDNMPEQLKLLTKFYREHYKSTVDVNEKLYYDKLSYILAYEAIDMSTNITNNIREHFLDHLNKFVNITFSIKDKMAQITKENKDKEIRKQKKKELYNEIKKVKDDLISINKNKTSDVKYHKWIDETRKNVLPNKSKFDEDSVLYDIKSKTLDYLKPMIYLGIELEKIYDAEKDYHKIRLFNILPLRTNIVVKNIVIDTCGLIQNFLGDESTTKILKEYKKDDNQEKLWERFFKTGKRVFKKNKYSFHHMIRSDGISSSILFIRNDVNGKPMKKKPSNLTKEDDMTEYIEKVKWTEEMKNKKIVCADPGMSDLLYFGSKNNDGNLETFRYTQNQRRLETRVKKYNKIMDTINNETKINDKSIKQLETELGIYNSRTNNYDKFKKYIIEKNKLNITLFSHYEQELFRKFKLNRFINTQKSESKMIKNFENKFGQPKDVIFVVGDYDKGDHNMKGVEPVICKKFRRIFKNAGYENYLVNEFRTSKLCNHCHNELEKFMEVISHKPRDIKDNKKIISNGLLRCQSLMPMCEIIHNRDKNAVQNMLFIVETIKTTGTRPKEFSRETV